MHRARISRGDDPRTLHRIGATARGIGGLFVRAYERGERVHLAMLSRGFTGAVPAFGPPATAMAWAAGLRVRAWAWAALALFYFTSVFWLTREINVPINNLVAGWNAAAPPAEWAVLRDRWNEANLWRALGAALSFVAALAVLQAPARRARANA